MKVGNITEADPETFASHIITIQGAIIAPFFVTDISIGIKNGIFELVDFLLQTSF